MAVQNRDVAATAAERSDRLRRQTDFRHENECYLSLADNFFDGAEIKLRLAAAGDAVQEKWPKAAVFQGGLKRVPGVDLTVRERERNVLDRHVFLRVDRLRNRDVRRDTTRFPSHVSLVYKRLDGRRPDAGRACHRPQFEG